MTWTATAQKIFESMIQVYGDMTYQYQCCIYSNTHQNHSNKKNTFYQKKKKDNIDLIQ